MTHDLTAETFDLLQEYFVDPLRKSVARFRIQQRSASHKIRRARRSATGQMRRLDTKCIGEADFSDPESQRVLAAAALAVARELGRQAAREFFAVDCRKTQGR